MTISLASMTSLLRHGFRSLARKDWTPLIGFGMTGWTHSAPHVIYTSTPYPPSPCPSLLMNTSVCLKWSDTDRFLSTALRLILTAPVHVASAERTFTRLKHVLTVRRAARDCQLLSRYALNMNLWDLWTRMSVQSQLLQQSVIGNPTS